MGKQRLLINTHFFKTFSLWFFAFLILVLSLSSATTLFAQGAGYALDFDGTDDYVDCGNHESLDITNAITCEAWVNGSSGVSSTQDDIRLTNSSGTSKHPDIAAVSTNTHIVWHDIRDGDWEIYYKRSVNTGESWSDDIRLTTSSGSSGFPRIAAVGNKVHVVWHDYRDGNWNIYYKYSPDNGSSWSSDIRLTDDSYAQKYPSLAVVEDNIHVIWHDYRDLRWEIYYKRSTNGGIDWSADTKLTNGAQAYNWNTGAPSTIDAQGNNVHIAWTDYRDSQYEIYYKKSTDNGVNWINDTRLTTNVYSKGFPDIKIDGTNIHLAWHDIRDGNREIYYIKSINNGDNWASDTRLTEASENSEYVDLVIIDGDPNLVWHDRRTLDWEIYFKQSTDEGNSWLSDERLTDSSGSSGCPQIEFGGSRKQVVWHDYRDSDWEIYFKRIPEPATIVGKGRDAYELGIDNNSYIWGFINNKDVSAQITSGWHHFVLSYDKTNISLYVDGVLKCYKSYTSDISTNANILNIGNKINGTIDEVRIWDVALDEITIRDWMCKKVDSSHPQWSHLKGYWRLDDESDPTDDYSTQNNVGSLKPDGSEPSWVWSGAALGDASAYDYTGTNPEDFTVNLVHTDLDDITATGDSGTITGIQVYRVDETSMRTDATPPGALWTMDPLRYWGVFVVGTSPTYTVIYNYDGHPGITDESDLGLAYRDDHSDNSWADLGATLNTTDNTLTKTGQIGTEYGLGSRSGDNSLPVEISTFTAQFLNGVPTLYWKTMSETDNIGWYIYRNTEEDFTTAERITDYLIEGHGTTTKPHYYIYEDVELDGIPGETYWYWIQSVDLGGRFYLYESEIVVIQGTPEHYDIPEIPKQYGLHQNEPNPLRDGSTEISFRLHNTARVDLKIYNIRGELVKNLYKGVAYTDDEVNIPWDGRDENGIEQGTGIYLYQLIVKGKTYDVKRLIVIR